MVGLGGLGVVTKMTLDILPTFAVQQEVYENLPLAQLEAHFEDIVSSAYSVSLFTDWRHGRVNQVWLKRRVADGAALAPAPTFFGATLAAQQRHPIDSLSGDPCTPQMGIPGPWNERLPHFRMDETPSSGEELQTEYFVPRQHAVAAMRAVTELHEQIAPLLMISEVRTDRRRHAVDEPVLPAGLRRHPLYLETELAGGPAAAPADRSAARAIQCPPALGQALYHTAGASAIALRQAARLSTAAALLRSTGQVPQRVPGYVHLLILGFARRRGLGRQSLPKIFLFLLVVAGFAGNHQQKYRVPGGLQALQTSLCENQTNLSIFL